MIKNYYIDINESYRTVGLLTFQHEKTKELTNYKFTYSFNLYEKIDDEYFLILVRLKVQTEEEFEDDSQNDNLKTIESNLSLEITNYLLSEFGIDLEKTNDSLILELSKQTLDNINIQGE